MLTAPGRAHTKMVTPKDLLEALRRHYEPPPSKPYGGVFATELVSPNGKRRADAIWAPVTHAERGTLVGHELKVSRADVVQELRDPMKADGWEPYCTRWWLVVPGLDIIDGLDVPDRWGILVAPKAANRRRFTVHRPAPLLTPSKDVAVGVATVLAATIGRVSRAEAAAAAAKQRAEGYQSEALRLSGLLAGYENSGGNARGAIFHTVNELVDALNQRAADVPALSSAHIDDIVEAVVIASAGRSATHHYLAHNANILLSRLHDLSSALHRAAGVEPPTKPKLTWVEEQS